MNHYQPENYQVIKELEHNAYHSLFLAEETETGRSVVINTLYKHAIPSQICLSDLRTYLHRVNAFTEDDSNFVIVTDYTEGIPFNTYVQNNAFTYDEIRNILSLYFEWAENYDKLDPYFETILSDPSQLHFHENQLITNEILFIEDGICVPQPFEVVKEKIKTVVIPLLEHWQAPDSEKKEVLLQEVQKLLSKQDFLKVDQVTHPLVELLSGIVQATVTSKHLKELPPLPEETVIALESLTSRPTREEKRKRTFLKLIVGAALIILGMLIYPIVFPKTDLPEASFTRDTIDGVLKYTNTSKAIGEGNAITRHEWTVYQDKAVIYATDDQDLSITLKTAGNYRVALRVKDKHGSWSKEVSESIYYEVKTLPSLDESGIRQNIETLDSLKIKAITDNVSIDQSIFNSGTKSIKMHLEKNKPGSFDVSGLHIKGNFSASLWLRSSDITPLTLTLKGYKGTTEVFVKKVTMSLGQTNVWQMIELKGTAEQQVDRLIFAFEGTSDVWVDDLDFNTYK